MRAEEETAALAGQVEWLEKAMWLLVRALGGQVRISDEEWEQVPEHPELIIDRADGVMRWTARERAEEKGAGI